MTSNKYSGAQRGHPVYSQRMLFTDGIGDYRVRVADFPRYIGVGTLSPEGTSELDYMHRAAPGTPAPMPKHCYVGGVGWGVQEYSALNARNLHSKMQFQVFKLAEFRQACEERVTHSYQNPWQPPPRVLNEQSAGARGKLAWTQNVYQNYYQLSQRNMQKQDSQETFSDVPEETSPFQDNEAM
nr:PREDICTED: uncharacterized protein C4orf45 homolog isoform X2 [Lepisosteus oculatus]